MDKLISIIESRKTESQQLYSLQEDLKAVKAYGVTVSANGITSRGLRVDDRDFIAAAVIEDLEKQISEHQAKLDTLDEALLTAQNVAIALLMPKS